MRDAISGLIGRYDQLGRYFDRPAIDSVNAYLDESTLRIQAVELINGSAAEIVREASQRLFRDEPDLLLPGGNAYTTRRLAACLRDMDYFLRYSSYALVAGDSTILNERVLNGLDDTYKVQRFAALFCWGKSFPRCFWPMALLPISLPPSFSRSTTWPKA